jgi:hypothetical protein
MSRTHIPDEYVDYVAGDHEAQQQAFVEIIEKKAPDVVAYLYLGALILAGLGILLAGMVLGHAILLPDATVWPLAVASLLCAAASMWLAFAGAALLTDSLKK